MVTPITDVVKDLGITPGATGNLDEGQKEKLANSIDWDTPTNKPVDEKEKEENPDDKQVPDNKDKEVKPGEKEGGAAEPTAEEKAAAEAAEKERVEKLAKEKGKTAADILAEEKAQQEEQERIEAKAKAENKTVEQVVADEKASVEKADNEIIKRIAEEEKIPFEQAKEAFAKDKGIIDRHAKDPYKLARAIRLKDSEFSKIKQEHDELKHAEEERQRILTDTQFDEKMNADRDKIVEAYRNKYPKDSENLSDDVIFERGKALLRTGLDVIVAEKKKEVSDKATIRRKEVLTSLPEEFSEFKPAVEEAMKAFGDMQVLNPKFDIMHLALLERGKKYTPAYVRSLEEAAEKRGKEQPKIIGRQPGAKPAKPAGGDGDPSTDGQILNMTPKEKNRARELYGRNEGWTERQMFEAWIKNDKGKPDF